MRPEKPVVQPHEDVTQSVSVALTPSLLLYANEQAQIRLDRAKKRGAEDHHFDKLKDEDAFEFNRYGIIGELVFMAAFEFWTAKDFEHVEKDYEYRALDVRGWEVKGRRPKYFWYGGLGINKSHLDRINGRTPLCLIRTASHDRYSLVGGWLYACQMKEFGTLKDGWWKSPLWFVPPEDLNPIGSCIGMNAPAVRDRFRN